jgi:hypothetical protein
MQHFSHLAPSAGFVYAATPRRPAGISAEARGVRSVLVQASLESQTMQVPRPSITGKMRTLYSSTSPAAFTMIRLQWGRFNDERRFCTEFIHKDCNNLAQINL